MSDAMQAERVRPLWFIETLAHVHVDGETSGGALALVESRSRRGDMPPLHVHHREDETFYVLEGQVTLFTPGAQVTLSAGQAMLAPRGVPHTYRVESEEARWLVAATPAGFDAFVREAAQDATADELPPKGRAHDFEAIGAAAARAGIDLLGPPGTLPEPA